MKVYVDFKDLFLDICEIKQIVVELNLKELCEYKKMFYAQNFPEWRLDLLWEFIWGDIDYPTLFYAFKNSRVI